MLDKLKEEERLGLVWMDGGIESNGNARGCLRHASGVLFLVMWSFVGRLVGERERERESLGLGGYYVYVIIYFIF